MDQGKNCVNDAKAKEKQGTYAKGSTAKKNALKDVRDPNYNRKRVIYAKGSTAKK
jgi:hypothetical protein